MIKLGEDPTKTVGEKETRKKLLAFAKANGFENDLLSLFKKYDLLLKNCTSEKERKDIGKMGAYEVFCLFNKGGDLYIDGQLVYRDTNSNSIIK